jgi:hypothetical protein
MNHRVTQQAGNSLNSYLLASQERLFFMEVAEMHKLSNILNKTFSKEEMKYICVRYDGKTYHMLRLSCPCALTEHHAMKAYWGSGGIGPRNLDLEVSGQVHAPVALPLWKEPLVPIAGLDAVAKRKIPSPCPDSNPRSSSPYSSAIPLSYPGSSRACSG